MRWLWSGALGFAVGICATAVMFSWLHRPDKIRYWWCFYVELIVPLLLLAGLIIHFFLSRRFSRRVFQIAGALSGRICILNRNEKILTLIVEKEFKELRPRVLSDIPCADYEKISAAVKEVFATGKGTELEYSCCGECRIMSISYLDKEILGEEAVVWFSRDNTSFENLRSETHAYAARLQKQSRMWQILIDTLPIHIFAKDVNRNYQYIFSNKAHSDFFHLTVDEMRGKNDFDLFSADLAGRLRREDEYNMLNLQKSEESYVSITDNEGKIHQLQLIQTPFVEVDGTKLLLGAVMDVTELEMMRKHVEDSAARFLQMLNSIDEAVIATDQNGSVVMLNPVAERMLEISEKDLLGKPLEPELHFFNAKNNLTIPPPIMETLEKKITIYSGDNTVLVNKSGRHYNIEGNSIPIFDGKKRFTGVMLVFRDMTARRKAAAKVVEALRKARAADRSKSLFIASVSHEIRTPLNAVIGFAELLRSGNVSPKEQDNYLESISFSGNALLQLINDVLDLSKLEADQIKIVTEAVDFKALVNEIIQVFKFRAMENRVDIKMDIPDLPELNLDKLRIRQILFNLVGNAIKFTPDGTITIWAKYQADRTFKFGVTDTGIGISAEDQKTLMEPFMQASRIRGTAVGNSGTGLGLAICKRLAEKMNGLLTLHSELGVGSTFTVMLYQTESAGKVAEPQAVVHINDRSSDNQEREWSILLVDDVDMNLTVMRAMLKKLGVTDITTANSGPEALKLLEENKFNLILTDMWMPGMSGAEFAGKVRANPHNSNIPIFVVTADIEVGENFQLNDFSGVLLKPVNMEKLTKLFNLVSDPDFVGGGGAQLVVG